MTQKLLNKLYERANKGQKSFAVLIDPDKLNLDNFFNLLALCVQYKADYIFVGGSLIIDYRIDEIIARIKVYTDIPVILFPGNSLHIHNQADAILLLSLISGRNPEFLIGQHVISAPVLRKSGLEILSTGYMLIDSGQQTTVSYISNTMPIPHDKPGIAACTAMAGEMLGLKLTYLDAGSGAMNPVSAEMIAAVKQSVDTPIIVGGGINSIKKAKNALSAGADVIVVGNGIEENVDLLREIAFAVSSHQSTCRNEML